MELFSLTIFSGLICLALICRCLLARPKLPPGPPRWPIIGNLFDLPPKGKPEYLHWLNHKNHHGPISSISVLGKTLVILHDRQAAHHLLESQSLKSSARPELEFASNICGYGNLVPLQQYNSSFRKRRRLIHQLLGTKALVNKFNDDQEAGVRRILFRAMFAPRSLVKNIQSDVAATILKVAYGYTTEFNDADPLVTLVEDLISHVSKAAMPAGWLVDLIPWIKYLPAGFPGTGFKKIGRHWRRQNQIVVDVPYEFTQKQMAANNFGFYPSSYVAGLLQYATEEKIMEPELETDIKWTAAVMYDAGAHTTVSALKSFIAAMVKFPDVQKKAQNEIDRVVGTSRLPEFSDRASLPYIEALVQETHRWYTVVPLGFPHATTSDLNYDGYDIPKGTIIITNVWWMLHDPDTYADPEQFQPERFMAPRNEPLPTAAFGAIDETGAEVDIDIRNCDGVVPTLADFECEITPRSAAAVALVAERTKDLRCITGDSSLLDQGLVAEGLITERDDFRLLPLSTVTKAGLENDCMEAPFTKPFFDMESLVPPQSPHSWLCGNNLGHPLGLSATQETHDGIFEFPVTDQLSMDPGASDIDSDGNVYADIVTDRRVSDGQPGNKDVILQQFLTLQNRVISCVASVTTEDYGQNQVESLYKLADELIIASAAYYNAELHDRKTGSSLTAGNVILVQMSCLSSLMSAFKVVIN
ncbi:hypothetical protein NLG97_g389 [Lecanicillium saksenae]|uniref:Uncharacterized protein n=1 Tax=Lecanicillium saksenae TaxID=468837 RepID=A0ACC1RA53_9HYPO|nr:hypothetical protein NLG97_g389 [Lecanicillium saksenae]